jgi:amino acid transporter
MGWNYVFQWAIVLPLELTVAALTVQYWKGAENVNIGVWITIFYMSILLINVFGVLGYAEEEFWSSVLKLGTVVVFMIMALIMVLGGAPANSGPCGPEFEHTGCYREYWGARYWYDPGAFRNGFKGFCSVFVTAAFAFSGTELVGLAAAESSNPLKQLPGAVKQVFWRITLYSPRSLYLDTLCLQATGSISWAFSS